MTLMLASVADAKEAQTALAAGADIIDGKDPTHGALAALPRQRLAAIRGAVGAKAKVSATAGDWPMIPARVCAAVAELAGGGLDFIKIGLLAEGEAVAAALAPLAARQALIAVLFADRKPGASLIDAVASAGFAGVMVDTAQKDGRGLCDFLAPAAVAEFIARAHRAGLWAGLAGSLTLADIPVLLPLGPDFLGFRGALCAGSRKSAIDPALARAVRAAIPRREATSGLNPKKAGAW